MRIVRSRRAGLLIAALALPLAACSRVHSQSPAGVAATASPLKHLASIELPDVPGRLDHMALDARRKRLYVAAHARGALLVVDLEQRQLFHLFDDIPEAQGVLYLPDSDRIVVSSGELGAVLVFDAESLSEVERISLGKDVDNLRYDPVKKRLFAGWGEGAVTAINAETWKVGWTFGLEGHPESFQLAADGLRIFVNVPSAHQVVVIDRSDHHLVAAYPIKDEEANYPMALIESEGKLAIGCRRPARLVLLDIEQGTKLASNVLSGDVDDLFYDAAGQRLIAACGEGFVDVFTRTSDGDFRIGARTPTAPGARTGAVRARRSALLPRRAPRGRGAARRSRSTRSRPERGRASDAVARRARGGARRGRRTQPGVQERPVGRREDRAHAVRVREHARRAAGRRRRRSRRGARRRPAQRDRGAAGNGLRGGHRAAGRGARRAGPRRRPHAGLRLGRALARGSPRRRRRGRRARDRRARRLVQPPGEGATLRALRSAGGGAARGELERSILEWLERVDRGGKRPGGAAGVRDFARAHNIGMQRARAAFIPPGARGPDRRPRRRRGPPLRATVTRGAAYGVLRCSSGGGSESTAMPPSLRSPPRPLESWIPP
jgi:hypothetical protein